MSRYAVTLPVSLVWLAACNTVTLGSDSAEDDGIVDANPTGPAGDDDDDDNGTPEAERPLAGGVTLTKVSIYQGVEAILYEGGQKPTSLEMPVILSRPARLRVFVTPEASFEPRNLTALLTVSANGSTETLESTASIDGPSRDEDPDTTFVFDLDGTELTQTTEFSVEIVEETSTGPGGGAPADTTWSSTDQGGLDKDTTDELQIVLIPVEYNADGSGRLPDTGPAEIDAVTSRAMGIYPATNVVVRVGDVLPWNRSISSNGNGWSTLLAEINDLRDRANEPPNTYYYGVFKPEASFNTFCRFGCVLGLSLLAFNANDPYFRASIGVGYGGIIYGGGDMYADTQVHEMGHAHGRDHAPCGVTGDRNYPYNGAKIGAWGYSVVTGEMFHPADTVDMMSYCTPIWVSDYTQFALYERIHTVAQQRRAAPTPRSVVTLDVDGVSTLMDHTVSLGATDGAPRVDVWVFDEAGTAVDRRTAAYFPYDHIAGGIAALDDALPPGWTAEVVSAPLR